MARSVSAAMGANGGVAQNGAAQQMRGPISAKGADLDAVVKDAQNLMNELNLAPALSSKEEAAAAAAAAMYGGGGGTKGTFDTAVELLAAGANGDGGAETPTGGASTPGRRGGSRSHRRGLQSASSTRSHGHSRQTATPRTNSKSRSRGPAGGYEGVPLPCSILEQPIQDPVRDAYYGGGDDDVQVSTPSRAKRGKRSGNEPGPRSLSRHSKRSVQSGRHRGPTSLQSGQLTPNASPRSVRSSHAPMSPSHAQAYVRTRLEREQSSHSAAAPGL
jgi:hypothetical protein